MVASRPQVETRTIPAECRCQFSERQPIPASTPWRCICRQRHIRRRHVAIERAMTVHVHFGMTGRVRSRSEQRSIQLVHAAGRIFSSARVAAWQGDWRRLRRVRLTACRQRAPRCESCWKPKFEPRCMAVAAASFKGSFDSMQLPWSGVDFHGRHSHVVCVQSPNIFGTMGSDDSD